MTHLRILYVLLPILTAACGSPPDADGTISQGLSRCRTPTLAQCQDPGYLDGICGRYQKRSGSRCARLLNAHLAEQYVASNPTDVIVPEEANDDREIASALVEAEDRSGDVFVPDYGSYESLMQYEVVAKSKGLGAWVDLERLTWNRNGNRINSCKELAHEKFYDVSSFHDAIASLGTDYRAIYNVAFGPSSQRSSIGTRHLTNTALRGRDGQQFGSVDTTVTRSKNAFTTAEVRRALLKLDDLGIRPTGDAVLAKVKAARSASSTNKNLAWHRASGRRLALAVRHQRLDRGNGTFKTRGYLDEELNDMFDVQQEATELAKRLNEMSDANSRAAQGCTSLPFGAARFACLITRSKMQSIGRQLDALLTRADAIGCLETGNTVCDWSPKYFNHAINHDLLIMDNESSRAVDSFGERASAVYTQCYNLPGSPWNLSWLRNYTFEGYGRYHSIPPRDYTRSPSAFNLYFRELARWRVALARHERDQAKQRLQTNPEFVGARGELVAPSKQISGGDEMGNRWFGLDYGYDVSWKTLPSANNVCNIHANFYSSFDATAKVLTKRKPIIAAHANAGALDELADGDSQGWGVDVDLQILGRSYLDDLRHDDDDGQHGFQFSVFELGENLPRDLDGSLTSDKYDFELARSRFPVAGIPILVKAGVSGQAGLDYHAHLETSGLESAEECSENGLRFDIDGGMKPWVKVNGYADASIDAWLVSAGVRGELLIIGGELPFTAQMSLGTDGGDANRLQDITLRANTRLDMELRTLDGRLSAYIRGGGYRASKKIASWRGLSYTKNLLANEFAVSVSDIAETF